MGSGKLKQKRRKNRRKKALLQIGSVLGIVLVFMVAIAGMADSVNQERPNSSQQVTSQGGSSDQGELAGSEGSQLQNSEAESSESQNSEIESSEVIIEPSEEESDTIQVVMIGDMLMHSKIIDSGKQEDGSYNFEHLFKNVKDFITEADIAIVNQETIMGGSKYGYTGYPSFNTPYALADALVDTGFNVILHATNHTLDKGKTGVLNCMDYWDTNYPNIKYIGMNRTQAAQNEIYVYEQDGFKIAILNYTYGTNGIKIPSDMPYLVNLMDEDKIRADIRKAEEIADFTILCPHWGTEYKLQATNSQKEWAQIFLEEGVDLVMGTHPHVIEPIEWLTDDEGNKMLVYYSLGNFVNGTASKGSGVTNRMVGGIADVTLGRNENGEVEIVEYGAVPIVCHVGTGTEYTVYYMKDYTEELASKNLILSQDSEFSKELCESIFAQVWGVR